MTRSLLEAIATTVLAKPAWEEPGLSCAVCKRFPAAGGPLCEVCHATTVDPAQERNGPTMFRDKALDWRAMHVADKPMTQFYAHQTPQGWAWYTTGLITAGWWLAGWCWMATEMKQRMVARDTNALGGSMLLIWRQRGDGARPQLWTDPDEAIAHVLKYTPVDDAHSHQDAAQMRAAALTQLWSMYTINARWGQPWRWIYELAFTPTQAVAA